MIPRLIAPTLNSLLTQYPIVTILWPRQSGKSTIVKSLFKDMLYINLEAPDERQIIQKDPRAFLAGIPQAGVIIDEIQRLPELLSYIPVTL